MAVREICVSNRTTMNVKASRRVAAGPANGGMANLERIGDVPAFQTVCLRPEPALQGDDQLVVGASTPTNALCAVPDSAVDRGVLRVEYSGRGACRRLGETR
jgi:hypothetical protein